LKISERTIAYSTQATQLISEDLEKLILSENSAIMYSLFRIMDCISLFELNTITDHISDNIPKTEE